MFIKIIDIGKVTGKDLVCRVGDKEDRSRQPWLQKTERRLRSGHRRGWRL